MLNLSGGASSSTRKNSSTNFKCSHKLSLTQKPFFMDGQYFCSRQCYLAIIAEKRDIRVRESRESGNSVDDLMSLGKQNVAVRSRGFHDSRKPDSELTNLDFTLRGNSMGSSIKLPGVSNRGRVSSPLRSPRGYAELTLSPQESIVGEWNHWEKRHFSPTPADRRGSMRSNNKSPPGPRRCADMPVSPNETVIESWNKWEKRHYSPPMTHRSRAVSPINLPRFPKSEDVGKDGRTTKFSKMNAPRDPLWYYGARGYFKF